MPSENWDRLSEKHREVWRIRYQFGWRMKRIAIELGISASGASKMLGRIHKRAGLPKYRVSVIRRKPGKPRRYRSWSGFMDLLETEHYLARHADATR